MNDRRPDTVEQLEPGLRRVLAPNPSRMTAWGTNTYIVGEGRVAVIDPGPDNARHYDAVLAALLPGESISHIFVTHSHIDHSPLAAPLSQATGAPVIAYGDSRAGRSAVMEGLAAQGGIGGGEGVDLAFSPDEVIADATEIAGDGWTLTALWTPGHLGNHFCFVLNDAVFTGDHIMGWASSLISPPDGDLTAFMASTRRLAVRNDRIFYPGHGGPITEPKSRANWLIRHRKTREAAVLGELTDTPQTVSELAVRVYHDVAPSLRPAAERNLFAHLIDLAGRNLIAADPTLAFTARFTRA